jgi:uncharacterized protein YkwD
MDVDWVAGRSLALLLGGVFALVPSIGCSPASTPNWWMDPNSSSGGPTGMGSSGRGSGGSGGLSDAGKGAASSSGGAVSSSSSGGSVTRPSGGTNAADAGHAAATARADAQAASGTVTGDSGGLMGAGDAGDCPAPSGIGQQQTTALQIINQTRAAMGSPCATEVPTLITSATNHCNYYAMNLGASGNCNSMSNPHGETSGCPGFTGADFGTRATMGASYHGSPASEVMAFNDDPTQALAQWIGSIYHRTPTLDPWTRDFGYGSATGCDTIDFGVGGSTPGTTIVSYPYDGQTGVGLVFDGRRESPMPPMPSSGWPSGFPIHVYMQATSITLTTDEFGVDGGSMLSHQVMLPQSSNGYLNNALVLYGDAQLNSQTKYRVHVAGTRQNMSFFGGGGSSAQFDVSFAFTTQ